MSGPYYNGQKSEKCGCYYPDVHHFRDVPEENQRILRCITHGEYPVELGNVSKFSLEESIPSDKQLEKERERLRKL